MSNDDGWFLFAIICAFVFGTLIGGSIISEAWKSDAINHGVGQYNSTTAKFEWIITDEENDKNEQTE